MTDLPHDPAGWNIFLTDDGQWQPQTIDRETTLPPEPSKIDAVAAVAAHEGDARTIAVPDRQA